MLVSLPTGGAGGGSDGRSWSRTVPRAASPDLPAAARGAGLQLLPRGGKELLSSRSRPVFLMVAEVPAGSLEKAREAVEL